MKTKNTPNTPKVENVWVNGWFFEEDNKPKPLSYEEVSQLLGWERKVDWTNYEN